MSRFNIYYLPKWLKIAMVFLFVCKSAIAQPDASRMFSKYTTKQGLLINSIYDIERSRNGMWWIGTGAGLQRFDGYGFETWTEPADKKDLSNPGVQRVYEDSLGNVWAFNFSYHYVFPAGKKKYELITIAPGKKFTYPNVYLLPLMEYGGRIWCMEGNSGIYGINQQTKKLDTIIPLVFKPGVPALSASSIPFIGKDTDGSIWISQDQADSNYLVHFIPGKAPDVKTFSVKDHGRLKAFIPLGSDEFLYLSTTYAAICNGTDPAKPLQIISRGNIPGNYIRMFSYVKLDVYNKGNILFSGDKGLYEFNPSSRLITPYATSAYPEIDLSRQFLFAIKEDIHGNIWLARDASDGLLIFFPGKLKFAFSKGPARYFNIVYSLAADKDGNMISAGYQKGLNLFSKNGEWKKYIPLPETEDGLTTSMRCMNFIDPDHLVMKSLYGKLAVLDLRDHSIRDISHLLPSRVASQRNSFDANFVPNGLNALQFVHGNYLLTIEKNQDAYKVSVIDSLMQVDRITVSAIDAKGHTILGSINGIFIKNNKDWKQIRGTEGIYVKHLAFNEDGTLWMASSSGIYLFKDNVLIKKYDESSGLLNHFVYGILFDNEGNAWYSSNKGLGRIEKTGGLKFFTAADGLQGDEFDTQSFWKSSDGKLHFGGTNGITSFYPQDILQPGIPDKTILTSLQVNGEDYPSVGRIENMQKLDLPYNMNALSFSFSLTDVSDPAYIVYQTRMDGFDKEWVNLRNVHSTRYLLPPGSYTIHIRGSNDGSKWSAEVLMPIVIHPPWWQTIWFKILAGFFALSVLAGSFWFFTRRKTERLRQQLILQQEMQKERERISRDLHDNIGAYSTAMIANTDSLEPMMNDNASKEKLMHLKDNARHILTTIRETIWLLNSKNLNVQGFTDGFMNYCINILRNYEGIEIEFSDNIISNKELSPAIAINLLRILQEQIQNIVKHSGASMIRCDIRCDEVLTITVSDNGKGFDINNTTIGNGLGNIKYRAHEIGFSLDIITQPGMGTEIILKGRP
ncbi:MAG TPA: sensor histidine kinase [Chitinophagaceae bacterium]|nr:sensor histidine kinase [Chitinophagaceae bacterium]